MNDQDGERELVLGNRQLLTIFFVAALLCGVFFAMGYVVGGNSAKSAATAAAAANDNPPAAATSEGKREEPRPAPPPDAATNPSPAPDNAAGSQLPGPEPKVADNPVAAGATPPLAAATPPGVVSPGVAPAPKPSKPATPLPTPAALATTTAAVPGIYLSVPETGASYWQVAALARPDADNLVKIMRDKGLPAILALSSKPELFEVLVGPYRSAPTLAEAKRKLIDLGYGGLIIHKQ